MLPIKGNTLLANLLDSFDSTSQPGLKMSVNSSRKSNRRNNSGREVKSIRCRGKLVKKNGKLVPKVECSTKKMKLPKQENRNYLLREILGEVEKSKQKETRDNQFNNGAINENPLLEMKKKPCGCRMKKYKVSEELPPELFPEANRRNNNFNQNELNLGEENHEEVNHNLAEENHEEANHNLGEETQNVNENTTNNNNQNELNALLSGVKANSASKSKKKKRGKKKSGKKKYKTVTISVKQKAPTLPAVKVQRKKKKKKSKKKPKSANNN